MILTLEILKRIETFKSKATTDVHKSEIKQLKIRGTV